MASFRDFSLPPLDGVRVVAAMSGGVDSSVAAALLRETGAEVVGVFMHLWDHDGSVRPGHGSCCAPEDAYDARRVADRLGIPFYNLDMREHFRRDVVDPFIEEYGAGRTPNPCALCNRHVKFGALLDAADRLGARFVATGHYVRRAEEGGAVRLFRGRDARKDQSYFLATLDAHRAARTLFPVGDLDKARTRELAAAFDLPTASKRESQDVCFIPDGDRVALFRREGATAGLEPGEIVDASGRVLGRHAGVARYTIGQRRGLGLPDGPWRVTGLDAARRRVVVDRGGQPRVGGVRLDRVAWVRPPARGEAVAVQLRYAADSALCRIEADGRTLTLASSQPATAPGQVAAIYAGSELLGGGLVVGTIPAAEPPQAGVGTPG